MPKVKQIEKCKHPNSRRTKALTRQIKKQNTRNKLKLSANIKQNLLGEKLLWLRDNLNIVQHSFTSEDIVKLISKYLGRFDAELEQIRLKHAIGQRKNRQHASREDIINMTLKREKEEFSGAGVEMPDLFNSAQVNMLKNWTGELRFLQNFKLRRFSITNLKEWNKSLTGKKHENESRLKNTDPNKNNNEDQQQIVNNTVREEISKSRSKEIRYKSSEEKSTKSMDIDV